MNDSMTHSKSCFITGWISVVTFAIS